MKHVAKEERKWRADQSRLTQKKPDNLEYSTIIVCAKRTRCYEPPFVKRQNWTSAPENLTQTFIDIRSEGAVRKITYPSVTLDIERKELNSSPFCYKTCLGCCSRTKSKNDNELLAKEFCNILGPDMCNECFKSRKKMIKEAELTHTHPDVRVSPYALCVAQNKKKAIKFASSSSPKNYRECDTLYRSAKLARPYVPIDNVNGLKTRPNSSNEKNQVICFDEYSSYLQSPSITLPSCGSPCPCTPDYRARRMPPKITRNSARGSSETRLSKSESSDAKDVAANEKQEVITDEDDFMAPGVQAVTVRKVEPKPRQNKDTSANSKQGSLKSARIERTGKLSELPYWKFLTPEPPQMGLERMNVSIYTPKSIPGIKIFDESLFEI